MRISLISFVILLLTACSSPLPMSQSYIPLYHDASSLTGQQYRFMGEVSGSSCQMTLQDHPATISDAQADLALRASGKADAVLLKKCEWLNGIGGCRNAAICVGKLIRFNE